MAKNEGVMWTPYKWNNILIEHISMKGKTREYWQQVRSSLVGIGGSEIGIVMGIDDYCSPTRLFYDKVGLMPRVFVDNAFAASGRFMEPSIVRMYEAYDEDPLKFYANLDSGKRVRRVTIRKDIFRVPEYDWLFFNLDGVYKQRTIIEAKQVSGKVAEKWDVGFPLKYLLQVQAYMLLPKMKNAHICILQDGVHFSFVDVPKSEYLQQEILSTTKKFVDAVKKGREIVAKYGGNIDLCMNLLSEIEPNSAPTVDFSLFLSEKHKLRESLSVQKADETLENAIRQIDACNSQLRELEAAKVTLEVKVKNHMERNGIGEMNFEGGYARFYNRFTIKVK